MAIRFRRRIKLAPGLHLNVSGSGLSLSAGPRGASMTFGGRRGTYMNAGIPGTGFSARQRVGSAAQSLSSNSSPSTSNSGTGGVSITITVEDDGTVVFRDEEGGVLDDRLTRQAKQEAKDAIQGLMQRACDEINSHTQALEQIHHATPSPDRRAAYEPQPYSEPKPARPLLRKYGMLDRMLSSRRGEVDQANAEVEAAYNASLLAWNRHRQEHEAREVARKAIIEQRVLTEVPAMEIVLEESLMDIVWPRETAVSSEIRDHGRVVMIDVDLPEIEDLPRTIAAVPARGYKLSIKELPVTRHQQLYMRHVHGIGFRIIGEIFFVLPKAEQVVLSGYTQRPDTATGDVHDQYVYSVRVNRRDFAGINFANLPAIDPVEALGRFDIRREITRGGLLKTIEPFEAPAAA
ncbi:DUF4236 domain-containing protein [Accumulibacter sp.]|jgi:hypothetical protein|uniref:DUF4236 domain-containing protein n=1 Tax=Accumulibacter sp. TaxID=2053492 RepID=UPI001AD1742C|nr:DUF4236 domain-containing protein [Accumulibacter sp.]MBN8453180.1 DUF4236 domain-containing protein [Accumulibacter sp.]